jgi:hypothetical protein
VSATGNVTGNFFIGNGSLLTGISGGGGSYSNANVATFLADFGSNSISTTGNITSGNLVTAGLVSATGNVTAGNVTTAGIVSATGNVTGNFFIGNGSQLTGIAASGNAIFNGTSNVAIPTANGAVQIAVGGVANTVVAGTGTLTVYGAFATPKLLESNVVIAEDVNAMMFGPLTVANVANIAVPTSSTLYIYGSAAP